MQAAIKFIKSHTFFCLAIIAMLLVSCRGQPFNHQPIHPVMNMDQQRRFEAQEENPFYANNRAMRQPVDGTVARGKLKLNSAYYRGLNEDSSYVAENPMDLTKSFIYRGKDQYEVYCQVCHGKVGAGKGIIMEGDYNYVPAPSYHTERLRDMPDGQIYSSIADGVRNMPSYATQISVRDRWAIVAYVRALQRSQYASKEEVAQMQVSTDSLMSAYKEQQQAAEAKKAKQEKAPAEVSVERGKKLFAQNACGSCHSLDGTKGVGPSLKGLYEHEVTLDNGETVTADEAYLKESITNPGAKIVQGYQPVMPNVSGGMSEADIQSIVEYLKTIE
mgnify:CR=1 FL=1